MSSAVKSSKVTATSQARVFIIHFAGEAEMLIRYKTKEISVNNGGIQSFSALVSKNKSPFMNKLAGFRLGNFLGNLFQRLVYAWKVLVPKGVPQNVTFFACIVAHGLKDQNIHALFEMRHAICE